jgi:hypothetical protein
MVEHPRKWSAARKLAASRVPPVSPVQLFRLVEASVLELLDRFLLISLGAKFLRDPRGPF